MPLLVRNTQPNTTVFAKGAYSIIWATAGDPMGEDVQMVPDDLKDDVDFIKSVRSGILLIEDGAPDVLANIDATTEAFQARRDAAQEAATANLDRRQDRDIVQVSCIGPNPNGRGGVCEAAVLVRSAQTGEAPPLCPRHESLSAQFYLVDTGSVGESANGNTPGKVAKVWKRAEVTAPARA